MAAGAYKPFNTAPDLLEHGAVTSRESDRVSFHLVHTSCARPVLTCVDVFSEGWPGEFFGLPANAATFRTFVPGGRHRTPSTAGRALPWRMRVVTSNDGPGPDARRGRTGSEWRFVGDATPVGPVVSVSGGASFHTPR
jgi:hypothetical protein